MIEERKESKHIVKVFDPNKDPSVAEQLKAEQAKNPTVTAIRSLPRMGIIETPKGTFCLESEGVGDTKTLEQEGCAVSFYREHMENGTVALEIVPFARAVYSLAEVKACLTGEEVRLDLFIDKFGRRKEENYLEWERALS